MQAFERVSRTIQRLCNGYASLPGLLEWGRTTAARLEATTTAGNTPGLGGEALFIDNHNKYNSGFKTYRPSGRGAAGDRGEVSPRFRGATAAAPRIGGPGYDERRLRGQEIGSATGVRSSGNHASPSSDSFSGDGLTNDRHRSGVWASSVVAGSGHSSSASASTASVYGRGSNITAPSRTPPATAAAQAMTYFPKKATRAGGGHFREATGNTRKGSGMSGANDSGSRSSRGVLCATEYGGGGDLWSLGSHRGGSDGDSCSSVASLLREERAFKQRTGAFQG